MDKVSSSKAARRRTKMRLWGPIH